MLAYLLPLAGFGIASSITPGPNNLMLLASGANFGFRRTLPHMVGISLGHAFMVTLVGLGLLQIFNAFPASYTIMKVLSAAYLLYLAWKIANAAAPSEGKTSAKPFTFLQAAAFQWVNPKAWYMALTAQTQFANPELGIWSAVIVAAVFAAVNFPSVTVWAYLGVQLKNWLGTPARLRAFNITMALLLVATLYPMLTTGLSAP